MLDVFVGSFCSKLAWRTTSLYRYKDFPCFGYLVKHVIPVTALKPPKSDAKNCPQKF